MSDWGQGYHVGIAYTLGFYPELAPSHLEAALLFAGFKSNLSRAGARYCELGCGYGLTTLVLAATNPHMSFVGVDFNPTHIVAARALVESARLSNVHFVEASFDELLEPRFADLGDVPMPMTPAEFGKFIADETEKWGKVIHAANIKPE